MTNRYSLTRAGPSDLHTLSRRKALFSLGAAGLATLASFRKAHGLDGENPSAPEKAAATTQASPPISADQGDFRMDNERANVMRSYSHVHDGKGAIDIKLFFQEEKAAQPAVFLIYTIPPGASEGVHVHKPGDAKLGSFDEFYYIISGSGEMEIAGEKVPVKAGDNILTPNGVWHGIENNSPEDDLRVYLLAMVRA